MERLPTSSDTLLIVRCQLEAKHRQHLEMQQIPSKRNAAYQKYPQMEMISLFMMTDIFFLELPNGIARKSIMNHHGFVSLVKQQMIAAF
jgi:hypothetical protein